MKNYPMIPHRFIKKMFVLLPFLMFFSMTAMAQPKPPSTLNNPLAQALVAIMILLALAIAILAGVVNNATAMFREKLRKERAASKGGMVASMGLMALLLTPLFSLSQDQAAAVAAPVQNTLINGISPTIFYLMVGVIAVEVVILIALVYQLKFLMGLEKERVASVVAVVENAKPKEGWWWKLNRSTDIKNEAAIDLNKDYDGITELDNKLPPWWTIAFGITILFSVGYLYRYHVGKTAPLQSEEFQIAMKRAEAQRAAFLAKNASNVDENTVVLLDAAGIASGKTIFSANCVACHGSLGEGNSVGPNLADEYWLHGGTINDVFRTIKIGVVEKGMRSWKDDLTPVQIAQVSSFIISLQGTNPPNAREPQGEKFIPETKDKKAEGEKVVEGTTASN